MNYNININFSKKQEEQIEDYVLKHKCTEFLKNSGGFGSISKIGFKIESIGIGYCINIYCPYCKYEEDITNTDMW